MSGIVTPTDLNIRHRSFYSTITVVKLHFVCEEVVLEALNQVFWDLMDVPALAPDSVVLQDSDDFVICLTPINHQKTAYNDYVHYDVSTSYLPLRKDADV